MFLHSSPGEERSALRPSAVETAEDHVRPGSDLAPARAHADPSRLFTMLTKLIVSADDLAQSYKTHKWSGGLKICSDFEGCPLSW